MADKKKCGQLALCTNTDCFCPCPIGQIESNYDEITDSFDSMNLKGELLRGTAWTKRYVAQGVSDRI